MMGTIKPSKDQYLVVGDSRVDSKGKKKANKPHEKKRDKNKSQEDPPRLQEELPEEEEQMRNE